MRFHTQTAGVSLTVQQPLNNIVRVAIQALAGVLGRFEPSQLEAKLGAGGMMDTLVPMNRRAKLWELYLQHFKRIQGDAEEDFHELFGKAFIRAYEDQLDRLDSARHPDV